MDKKEGIIYPRPSYDNIIFLKQQYLSWIKTGGIIHLQRSYDNINFLKQQYSFLDQNKGNHPSKTAI